ncbi:interleukin-31 receptor subunit alpha [Suncus etruscus]|uniref:interleukin-31 receptor subunit alpha n=1 Tax=Suncus etruscus TaxID=109475 RepID=UPI00211047DB|nr:interleukin-31 receptor subunit alpha [Suncus etruscus]
MIYSIQSFPNGAPALTLCTPAPCLTSSPLHTPAGRAAVDPKIWRFFILFSGSNGTFPVKLSILIKANVCFLCNSNALLFPAEVGEFPHHGQGLKTTENSRQDRFTQPACVNTVIMWPGTLWVTLPLLCRVSLAALPAKPENITCILYFKKNLTCTWSSEHEEAVNYTVKRIYSAGNISHTCTADNSENKTYASCSFYRPTIIPPDKHIIQVEAQNADGTTKSDKIVENLTAIMKIDPPEILSVKPILDVKRMVQVKWERPSRALSTYTFKYVLRFRAVNATFWTEVNFTKLDFEIPDRHNLTGLQAFTEYVVALRWAVIESVFWSDWSPECQGTTEEEAPYGLDVWRVLGPTDVDGRRPVRVLWKKAKEAPFLEKALGYNIRYFPEDNTNLTKIMNTSNQQLELYLGRKPYCVSVTSYNSLGKSPVSTLRIPAVDEKSFRSIESAHSWSTQDQLVVEWQSSSPDVDTWMVEWVPDLDSEISTISWESVTHARNWTIQQDKLRPFWCYNISMYPMMQGRVGKPYSIQAYVKEDTPGQGPVTRTENIGVNTVTITWQKIPKSKRNGFINNYTIFYQAEDGKEFSKTVNSSILQYDLDSLRRKTSYTVQVMASTRAGGTNGTRITFKTLSISVLEIFLVTALVGGGLLILIILTMVYGLKKPNKLKHLCWPKVPNPAESSIAAWPGGALKDKLYLKDFDDTVNTEEDRILKPCIVPQDLIDKLIVNFENFLEEVSIEPTKDQENVLGGEENEYVYTPYRPYCPVEKSFEDPSILTKIPPAESLLYPEMPAGSCSESKEHLSSTQSLGPDHFSEEEAMNPYLKNSVTTREFLMSETLLDQSQRE